MKALLFLTALFALLCSVSAVFPFFQEVLENGVAEEPHMVRRNILVAVPEDNLQGYFPWQ